MASQEDSQQTQQATQNALDPRRIGKQNSGFSDEDIADIVCILYPNTENANREIQRFASSPEYSPHIAGRYTAEAIQSDLYLEDDARAFGRTRALGDHAIVLKMSSAVKSPALGFTFGRNATRCDICFTNDPLKRLSNIHFRIYVNDHGVVMLEDQSTNGTVVDDIMLRKKEKDRRKAATQTKRVLSSGSTIKVLMHENAEDLIFIVRIPRREDDLEQAYRRNLRAYLRKTQRLLDVDRTIGPGHNGPVNLFPPPFNNNNNNNEADYVTQEASDPTEVMPREWRSSERYNRVGVIGKGAFATVYKVTDKYTGGPYAAKEIDKRKFIKNGVLDQKVENEMKIMKSIHHDNIVQYIEHFDWDAHQMIIVMEYVPHGDLGKLIQTRGSINEPYAKVMASQLIDALGYLHDNKITHRDVKPDNILVHSVDPKFVVKLTDFGLSKMIDTEQTFLKTFCGTLLYCAPEVYSEYGTYDENGRRVRQRERKPLTRERYDHAVDIWSLGGVLFYALTGSPPFPAKNGTGYTELLHRIMTQPLNTTPLMKEGVSNDCVDFLSRMIDNRPETRATVAELLEHPWLMGAGRLKVGESFDEISDDGLEQGASQLSLHDRHAVNSMDDLASADFMEPEPDISMDFGEDKENYTFGQPPPNRLWGEVSALRSSGVIAEDRLNLPISRSNLAPNLGESDRQDFEVVDSFESEDSSTPRQKLQHARNILNSESSIANGRSQFMPLGMESQSLGGASAILENLNMKSLARTISKPPSEMSDFNTSKRKPAYDTSDEHDSAGSSLKPSFKRLKSNGDEAQDDLDEAEDDFSSLIAAIPQVVKNDSGRKIDYPLHKGTFWDFSDRKTWHLKYPEMTHSQYTAFKVAAERRKEEFGPGRTPLWDVAMEWFPPTKHRPEDLEAVVGTRPLLRRDSRSLMESGEWDMPPTAPPPGSDDDQVSLPDTLPPDIQLTGPSQGSIAARKVVARLTSPIGSVVKDVTILLRDPILSWGRANDNTVTYPHVMESRVPKNAFRILLWRDGSSLSDPFRPWDGTPSPGAGATRASPEPDSYAFYISTKATNGVRINNDVLSAYNPRNTKEPSKFWVKLYHGDSIVYWGTEDASNQARLTFECFWGGSSVLRPHGEPPAYVPETVAGSLDRTWMRAERKLAQDRIREQAMQDHMYRMRHMAQEQESSQRFEVMRAEVVRRMGAGSRGLSPVGASPVPGMRPVPTRPRQGTPAGLSAK